MLIVSPLLGALGAAWAYRSRVGTCGAILYRLLIHMFYLSLVVTCGTRVCRLLRRILCFHLLSQACQLLFQLLVFITVPLRSARQRDALCLASSTISSLLPNRHSLCLALLLQRSCRNVYSCMNNLLSNLCDDSPVACWDVRGHLVPTPSSHVVLVHFVLQTDPCHLSFRCLLE